MGRPRSSVLLVLVGLLTLPRLAAATFHLMSISEIGAGFGGNADVQFVELRLDFAGQSHVADTRLTAFDAAGNATELLITPTDVANGTAGANILYATQAFTTLTTIAPDFLIPAGIITPTGMICWGAPGASAPDPSTWDLEKPNNYVDCVAYGGFTSATRNASGTPTTLPPGTATQTLARTKNTGANGSNDGDFGLAAPNVCNNAGACTDLAGGGDTTCGDADGSGAVTVTDGVQTLRAAAGLTTPCTLATCDINGSGAITVTDGVAVLRGAAGLPLGGTCEPAS
ncbi:MAG: hypothetical protein ABIR79_01885 [Candidatus Binatia bacterium]